MPLAFILPGFDGVIESGSIEPLSYVVEEAREALDFLRNPTTTPEELSSDVDSVLAQADELEKRSKALKKLKYS